jgi:hypothetical protein
MINGFSICLENKRVFSIDHYSIELSCQKKEEKNITYFHAKGFDTDFLIDYATVILNVKLTM